MKSNQKINKNIPGVGKLYVLLNEQQCHDQKVELTTEDLKSDSMK